MHIDEAGGNHLAGAIDMAADEMPAEGVIQGQRRFQVDRAAHLEIAEAGFVDGFERDVGDESAFPEFDRRQAGAVDGDTVTELRLRQIEIATVDRETHIAAPSFTVCNAAQGLD